MILVISEIGVTSKAGFQTGDSAGAHRIFPIAPRTSEGDLSSIGMEAPETPNNSSQFCKQRRIE
jgi:hypothetical protein